MLKSPLWADYRQGRSSLFTSLAPISTLKLVMDKFWSVFAMPIGLALCFGPAVIVWWLTKDKASNPDKPQDRN
jgi:hypothetical protein